MLDLHPSRCAILVVGPLCGDTPSAPALRELERRGYSLGRIAPDTALDRIRSQAVTEILARGFGETLWVDSQLEFDPNDVIKLRSHAAPIVAGIDIRPLGQGLAVDLLPGCMQLSLGASGGLVKVQYASAGFLLVREAVYRSLAGAGELPTCTSVGGTAFVPYFLPLVKDDGNTRTYLDADFAFCERARRQGYDIFADTSIRLWRHGNYRYSWEDVGGGVTRHAACEFQANSAGRTAPKGELSDTPRRSHEPYSSPGIESLRRAHPWPEERPNVAAREREGWLFPSTQEMLARFLSSETKLVVELGSWLGLSTRFIAGRAPRATVIAIDHWKGSPEHEHDPALRDLLPVLYETFLTNCWNDRSRIVPIRSGTLEGLQRVGSFGLAPDVIYVDADHSYEAVAADLAAIERLFPSAIIVGDDWNWEGVRRAASEHCARTGRPLAALDSGWCAAAANSRQNVPFD